MYIPVAPVAVWRVDYRRVGSWKNRPLSGQLLVAQKRQSIFLWGADRGGGGWERTDEGEEGTPMFTDK